MIPADDPLRDLSDRVFRQALENPINLRALLKRAIPAIADALDYTRLQVLDREFVLDDWRSRSCDLLVEIPYQTPAGVEPVLVCILLEHQSRPDWRMPFRTLLYTVLYWDRQLKTWEQRTGDKSPFRFTPVIPIVLYAATKGWGSARTLAEMIDGPDEIRVFTPRWEPLFWELGSMTASELLNSREAFDEFLAIVRSETGLTGDVEPIVREGILHLKEQQERNRVYVSDMIRLYLTWLLTHRPASERDHWQRVAEEVFTDADRRREIKTMGQTIAEDIYERGQAAARVDTARKFLLRAARKKLGEPNAAHLQQVNDLTDVLKLESLLERVLDVSSWEELLRA